jgi:hypothetical protein
MKQSKFIIYEIIGAASPLENRILSTTTVSPTKNSTSSSTTTSNTAWGAIAKVKSKKLKGEIR